MTNDRYGEPLDDTTPHVCDNGWVDANADTPRPCLVCKPHLAIGKRRFRAGLEDYPREVS